MEEPENVTQLLVTLCKKLEAFRFRCCHNYATDLQYNKLESPSLSEHQRAVDELLEPLGNTRAVTPPDGPSIFKWGFRLQLGFIAAGS